MNIDYQLKVNGTIYTNWIELKYEHEGRDPGKSPTFSLKLPNKFGALVSSVDFDPGKFVEVYRAPGGGTLELVFKGVIEPRKFKINGRESSITITGLNVWYKTLQNNICDSYDFIESSTDYGVTINPWEFKVYRHTHPAVILETIGRERPVLDGYKPNDVLKHVIGTKFLYGHDFQDNSHLLPSTTKTSTSTVGTYRDFVATATYYQTTPRLQLMHNGDGIYQSTGFVESVSLYNGDPNIEPMGLISSVAVTIYGKLNGGTLVLEVCRNGQNSHDPIGATNFNKALREYRSVTLTPSDIAVPGTVDTITKFTGTISSWSGAVAGRELAYKLTFTAAGGNTASPEVEYILFDAATDSDSGISNGTFDTYVGDGSISGSDYFEGNLESGDRLKALATIREATIKVFVGGDPIDNEISTFWDVWVSVAGALNFKKNRGVEVNRTYSFENSLLYDIDYEEDGSDIWYKVIAYGAGSGIARTRIVSDEEFDDGGLTMSDVLAQYGVAGAAIGSFQDSNSKTVTQLYKKARAALKLHSKPFRSLRIPGIIAEGTLYYSVGDSIKVTISDLDITNEYFPVESIARTVNKMGEKLDVVLGQPISEVTAAIANLQSSTDDVIVVRQPAPVQAGTAANGTYFDNVNYGLYTFGISQPENIRKVALKVLTTPFVSTAKASSSESLHTHGMAHTHTVPGSSHSHTIPALTVTGTATANDGNGNVQTMGVATNNIPAVVIGVPTSITAPETGTSAWTTIATFTPITTAVDYISGAILHYNNSNDRHEFQYRVRVTNNAGGAVVTNISGSYPALSVTPQDADDTILTVAGFTEAFNTTLSTSATYNVQIEVGSNESFDFTDEFGLYGNIFYSHTHDRQNHTHSVNASSTSTDTSSATTPATTTSGSSSSSTTDAGSAHSHGLSFGIYAFDGDGGTGQVVNAVYATNVELWVDTLTVPGGGDAGKRLPTKFGNEDQAIEIDELDITSRLETDANGLIKRGIHRIWVKSTTASSPNVNGLGAVQIVPLIDYVATDG